MSQADYAPPVAQLLALGDVSEQDAIDYLALGLGPDHVPDLCRMILDEDLRWADSESAEVWSAVHAWRALAQIGSPDAIDALLALMERIDDYDDDWTMTELPDVFAAIGPVALPALTRFLADHDQKMWARVTCVDCLDARWSKRTPKRGRNAPASLRASLASTPARPRRSTAIQLYPGLAQSAVPR